MKKKRQHIRNCQKIPTKIWEICIIDRGWGQELIIKGTSHQKRTVVCDDNGVVRLMEVWKDDEIHHVKAVISVKSGMVWKDFVLAVRRAKIVKA
jgi:hypothetical protein